MKNVYAILDFNSVIKHCYNSGTDPDAHLIEGKKVNTAGYAIHVMVERYIIPISNYVPLNHIIVVNEDSKKAFRTAKYPEYQKARRERPKSADSEYIFEASQLALELFKALGVPVVSLRGEEADDVIAYLAENLVGDKHIYTNDGDLIALAKNPSVTVFQKLERKSAFKVKDLEIPPELVTLYKSLCGDSSDGYGGVKGFGPAKWEELTYPQLRFLDKVVSGKQLDREKLQEAFNRQPLKSLKLIIDNQADWFNSYHNLAKLHPELVDAKSLLGHDTRYYFKNAEGKEISITESKYLENKDNPLYIERTLPLYSVEFNRLNWVKRVPSEQALQEVLKKACSEYLIDTLIKFIPKQILVTPENYDHFNYKELFEESRFVSLDWETYDEENEDFQKANGGKDFVDMFGSRVSGMGITCGENLEHTFYFQFDHADVENNLPKRYILDVLGSIPAEIPVVAHNAMFELVVLQSEFNVTLPIIHDTMIMHTHIDELSDSHGLKDLTKRYLNYDQLHYAGTVDKGKTMRDYTGQQVFKYGADDPLVTAHLYDLFRFTLECERTWSFVETCEFPTVQLLASAHCDGVSIDFEEVERQKSEDLKIFTDNIAKIREVLSDQVLTQEDFLNTAVTFYKEEIDPKSTLTVDSKEIHDLADEFVYADYTEVAPTGRQKISRWVGTELNINSPKQMQYLFYGTLGLPIRIRDFKISETRKTKGLKGTPQVNSEAIAEAIVQGDAPEGTWKREILELFSAAKKSDTRIKLFYNKLPLWKHPKDGNIHPRFNSCGTESRRPTGGSPNLLQLSKNGEGAKVRACFIPNRKKEHNLVCSSDFDGEELRVIAGLSGDTELTSCYVGDNLKDVHAIVAAQIMGQDYDYFKAVMNGSEGEKREKEFKDIRKKAKGVVFGGNYGIGKAKLARQLHIPESEAEKFLDAKKEAYSGMEGWKEEVKAELKKKGYVSTLYGSRKHAFNHLNESEEMASYYERSAVNYLVQGVCADYLKVVLATLWKRKTFQRYNATLIAPLYDELIWTCHDSVAVPLFLEIHEVMTAGLPNFPVPMLANPAVGVNFRDQKDILGSCNEALTPEKIQQAISKVLV